MKFPLPQFSYEWCQEEENSNSGKIEAILQEDYFSKYEDADDPDYDFDVVEEDEDETPDPYLSTSTATPVSTSKWRKTKNVQTQTAFQNSLDNIGLLVLMLQIHIAFTIFFLNLFLSLLLKKLIDMLSEFETKQGHSPRSRYNKWKNIDAKNVKAFVALETGMGWYTNLHQSLTFRTHIG